MVDKLDEAIKKMVAKRFAVNEALGALTISQKTLMDYNSLVECFTREVVCDRVTYEKAAKEYLAAEQEYVIILKDENDSFGNIQLDETTEQEEGF